MRITIERLRTLIVAAGVLLIVALGVFLVKARFRNPLNLREMPRRLGIDIQQEVNGVTYSHALGAHSQFRIQASRAEQLKDGRILLHSVKIELFGQDGKRVDRIEGNEFNYDENSQTATAVGPVEITLMRPGVAPAIAPKASPDKALANKTIAKPLATAAEEAASGEIHVQTSGLSSNWQTGVTTTGERVNFSMKQGTGSALGATYDSQQGILVLNQDVQLTTQRGQDTVHIHAEHAVFVRDELQCYMRSATADYRGGKAAAEDAKLLFRDDGSTARLDANNGLSIETATGGRLAAPTGWLEFDTHSQPRHGHLQGGVRMESVTAQRQIHGTSPLAELEFSAQGQLRSTHLERGVEMRSDSVSQSAPTAKTGSVTIRTSREWHSQIADVTFREADHGQLEPATIHGWGSVLVTGESQRGNGPRLPSKLAADEMTGDFGPNSALKSMTGIGHTFLSETTNSGALETATGDHLQAQFAPEVKSGLQTGAQQVQSAVLNGHVVLVETPAAKKPGTKPQPPLRATADRAVYEDTGQWLHLTGLPRVDDGGLQVAADKIDVSQQSGNAFAHGNVKATWLDASENAGAASTRASGGEAVALGGQGPTHAIAAEAQIDRTTNQATFTGHARLWQQANSVAAPVIVLDRPQKTLVARSTDPAEPVRVVMLSAGGLEPASAPNRATASKPATPTVIRVRGGNLVYSDTERRALMVGGSLGPVIAETATATSSSSQVELFLLPAGKRGSRQSAAGEVDRLTASGHVVVTSQGRRGTGEKLAYTSNNGAYVLTGTPAVPPRMVDPARGTVTGEALIFHSRDDSVSIEGGERATRTETTVRRANGRSEPHN